MVTEFRAELATLLGRIANTSRFGSVDTRDGCRNRVRGQQTAARLAAALIRETPKAETTPFLDMLHELDRIAAFAPPCSDESQSLDTDAWILKADEFGRIGMTLIGRISDEARRAAG